MHWIFVARQSHPKRISFFQLLVNVDFLKHEVIKTADIFHSLQTVLAQRGNLDPALSNNLRLETGNPTFQIHGKNGGLLKLMVDFRWMDASIWWVSFQIVNLTTGIVTFDCKQSNLGSCDVDNLQIDSFRRPCPAVELQSQIQR